MFFVFTLNILLSIFVLLKILVFRTLNDYQYFLYVSVCYISHAFYSMIYTSAFTFIITFK